MKTICSILLAGTLGLLGAESPSTEETMKALVPTTVEVPLSLQTAPFDHDRVLMVPPGFSISVVARIPAARFIAPLSTGEILVARPATGSILVIRPQANGMVGVSTLIDGLSYAQGMALHPSGDRLYLYVGESKQVSRFNLAPRATSADDKRVIVPNLPDSSSPELLGSFTRIDKGIQAHSAPLGMVFLQDSKTPEPFREGIAIALHGSWDRSRKTGYKVIFFPWQGEGPGRQIDLVTGWLDDHSQSFWGRPVDVKPANDGSLLISDDYSGTVYRLALRDGP